MPTMNIFRILGTAYQSLPEDEELIDLRRRSLPLDIDSDIVTQDDTNQRTSPPNTLPIPGPALITRRKLTKSTTVMLGHILQIASAVPNRLHNALPRPILDLRRQPLQHRLQAPLPGFLRVYYLPNDHKIQAHARPKHRHLSRPMASRRLRRARHLVPVQMDLLRDNVGILDLARIRRHPAATIPATENRRGGDDYHALPVCVGELSRAVYPELDLSVFWGGTLGAD